MRRLGLMNRFGLFLFGSLLVLLVSCAPGTGGLQAPSFKLIDDGSGLVRLDPAGVGRGEAVFRLNLEISNGNAFAVRLAGLDGEFLLNDHAVARASFTEGVSIDARASVVTPLEVRVPLSDGLQVLPDLVALIAGDATHYRINGTVVLDVLGTEQRLPATTLVSGVIRQPIRLVAPQVRLNADATNVSINLSRASIDLSMMVENNGPLGYELRAPALQLAINGRNVAGTDNINVPIPAYSTTPVTLRFDLNLLSLGASVVNDLRDLPSAELSVNGAFSLDVAGITSASFSAQSFVSGFLR